MRLFICVFIHLNLDLSIIKDSFEALEPFEAFWHFLWFWTFQDFDTFKGFEPFEDFLLYAYNQVWLYLHNMLTHFSTLDNLFSEGHLIIAASSFSSRREKQADPKVKHFW